MNQGAAGLVIIGHPAKSSFNHALAQRVVDVWLRAGLKVTRFDLAAEGFAPCLSPQEARGLPSDEPAIRAHIAALTGADHLAVVHPVMWGMPPAVVKGWIDRVFALHEAYTFPDGAAEGLEAIGLLRLKTALILNTSNTPPLREAERFGDPLHRIWRDCILGYCSAARMERRCFAPLVPSEAATRAAWLDEASALARTALT
ncbi:NAD(P)H-dependent oxidoreductase [Pseudorhodobacter sp.]|uniref:NAD(P)H-dependent oxidoreductase n=1 Tax=Pseudorhodobacter sp. TaxID=1934400 RepID=UPI00264972CB|nr:NAD(P)H-dependent oxidoreductase [Pseudorhodobacter sp.]MDN5788720.1 NAD(P)H-dependent oxidoreductase [Pseudorhodobacter sp.]